MILSALVPGCFLFEGEGTITGGFQPGYEMFSMNEVDAADETYSDGKLYTLEIPIITDAASVTYRFVFSDGLSIPVGHGATERAVTITAP